MKVKDLERKPRQRKVKVWNGTERLRGQRDYLSVYVGAHSMKHALELLDQAGFSYMGAHHFKNFFSPAWGTPMAGIEPEVGVWVAPSSGPPVRPERIL